MKAHIVHAHPEPQSFTAAMRDAAAAALKAMGYQVTISDLYAMNFDPLISRDDFTHEVGDPIAFTKEQRAGWSGRTLDPAILAEADKTLAADLLVLTFPVYWFSVPAMLKGWMDRVLLSGPFYSGRDMYDRGGMKGKKALALASLGGRAHMFGPDTLHGPLGDGMLRHVLQGTLGVCGYDVLEPFFAYHAPYVKPEARTEMLEQLKAHVGAVETLPTLPMPSLSDFDEKLRLLKLSTKLN